MADLLSVSNVETLQLSCLSRQPARLLSTIEMVIRTVEACYLKAEEPSNILTRRSFDDTSPHSLMLTVIAARPGS